MHLFTALAILSLPVGALAADSEVCQVRIVLFVPANLETPIGNQERMDQIVNYAEAFFKKGFMRWGHRNVVMPFRRTEDGRAEVIIVRGSKPASEAPGARLTFV
ncbi:MAG: hypothetical protein IH991_22145 [Planctomycetes bacterium]|nr:hypothetical protein [Planctomycetota bacterium]